MPKQILHYKIESDGDIYVCKVEATYHVDGNWNADADGNRGTPRLFIDDVHIIDVMCDGCKVENTNNISPELKSKILAAVDEHI